MRQEVDREMGNETEFETRKGQKMGNKTEFQTRNGRKWEARRDKLHHFSTKKLENQGKNWKNRGKITIKKQEKTEDKKKLQEIQKQDFDEVSGNAENGNKFSTRFQEMLKTETRTKTRSSQMSRNDNLRAKTRYRCRPSCS